MLTFLRKIRQSLIGTNNTKRYLYYAFGEIILVVIGILLALQINNWNQNRINKKEEKRILSSVADEINSFRWQTQTGLRRYNRVLASSDRLITWVNVPEVNIPDDTVDYDLSVLNTRWLMGMSNENNIYDALTGSGELGLISSHELGLLLNVLKRQLMLLSSYETFQTNYVDNHLYPFLNKHIDGVTISDIRSRIRTRQYEYNPAPMELSIDKSNFGTSYNGLKGSKEFSNLLIQNMQHTSSLIPIYGRIENTIFQIDEILKEEDPSLIIENE